MWKGDTSLPRRKQGLVILGVLVRQVEFVKAQLEEKEAEHSVLQQRIPLVDNFQVALVVACCCSVSVCGARQFHHAHSESRFGRSICHGP